MIGAIARLWGGDFAYFIPSASSGSSQDDPETGVLLRRDEPRGLLVALPVRRGRPQRGNTLMTTPLAELNLLQDNTWNRAVCAWGAWAVR